VDLEDAANEATTKLDAIKHDLQESEGIYAELDHRIREATERLHADWGKVAAGAKAILDEIHHHKSELETERASVHEAHGHLKQEIDTAQHDSHDAIEHTHTELTALQTHATELESQHKQHLDDAAAKGKQFADRAANIEHELTSLVHDVGHFVTDEIGHFLGDLGKSFDEHGISLEHLVTDQLVPQIDEHTQQTASKLQEFHSHFEDQGNTLAEAAKTHSTDAVQKCTEDHNETLNTLHDAAQELTGTLGQLSSFVDKGTEIIHEGKEAMHTGVDVTSTGINLAIGIVKDLKDFFSHFSFL
jgi:chromosome segregation ATPase